MKKVLAIDMGATSIRGILGWIEDGKLRTKEVMRTEHRMVKENGRLRWQWDKLIGSIEETVLAHADEIASVGVDTWGVDFGLLDADGNLIEHPVCYRDPGHEQGLAAALSKISAKKLFLGTGTQVMAMNTLFQLIALQELEPAVWQKADTLLMMPDLVNYMLCGEKSAEETILSTAQVMDLETVRMDDALLDQFAIQPSLFPQLAQAGRRLGTTRGAKLEKVAKLERPVHVTSVCGHDTASAVMVTDAYLDPDCLFLSCGTWSLFGARSDQAMLTEAAFDSSLTNELGYGQQSLFFKNITGLYLIEKLRQELEEERGSKVGFDEINEYVLSHPLTTDLIDMEAPQFGADGVKVRKEIDAYLLAHGSGTPASDMDYFRIIYESLICAYRKTKKALEGITGRTYRKLHMIGGGAKSPLLCQMTADELNVEVVAGPFEATALGNLIVQLVAEGEIASVSEGIAIVQKTEEVKHYSPAAVCV